MKFYFQEKYPVDCNGFVVSAFEANALKGYNEFEAYFIYVKPVRVTLSRKMHSNWKIKDLFK